AEGVPAEGAPGAAASSARVRSGADEAGTVVCVVSAPASAPAGAAGFAGAGAESVSSQVGAAGRSLTAVEARCAPVPAGSVEVPSAGVVSSPGRLRPRLRRYAQAPAPITSTPPPLPAIRASRASGSTGHLRGSGKPAMRRGRLSV